jgi:4-amino-4-deoxy-L-arabinose transferase-like glycosyltransferase
MLVICATAVVCVGLAWRVLRYLLHFPIWGDEAFIALNVLDRDYFTLLGPLRFGQVAPVLFLWAERTAHEVLGDSELALRLFPFLAGVAALLLFGRLARQALDPLAATLAVGILAVAYYPVRHTCEVKPYAFDLFLAVALLALAVSWLREPQRLRWLLLLAAVVPIALAASYPAAFVAGAVSLALLPTVWRQPDWRARGLYALYNLLMIGAFFGLYRLAAVYQFHSTGGTANSYWADWFPPHAPLALARWLVLAHTGNLFAYPIGGHNGASTLTFLLCVIGVRHLRRTRRGSLLVLCLVPFGLTFLAALLHRYPYGGSARVAQHLAPAICLLAGVGLAAVLRKSCPSELGQRRAVLVASALLILFAAGGMAFDVWHPYKTDGDIRTRSLIDGIVAGSGADAQIVIQEPPGATGPTFEWYVRRHAERVAWNSRLDPERLDTTTQEIWCLHFARFPPASDGLAGQLAHSSHHWQLAGHEVYRLQMGNSWESLEPYEVFHWVRRP